MPLLDMPGAKAREDSVAHGSSHTMREPVYDDAPPGTAASRLFDSFRRDPSRRVTPLDPGADAALRAEAGRAEHDGLHYYDIHQATLQTAHSGLARKLKGRHLQMIAIGGSIGEWPLAFCTPGLQWLCPCATVSPIGFALPGTNLRFPLLEPRPRGSRGIRVASPPGVVSPRPVYSSGSHIV